MGGCYCSGEGTQSRVDIFVGSIGIVVGGIGIFVGGIGIVGVLLDEEMMVLLVVLPKDYWKLDVLLGRCCCFIVVGGYCGILSMMAEVIQQSTSLAKDRPNHRRTLSSNAPICSTQKITCSLHHHHK